MDSIERLTSLFERFPGIGPRQAGRFVQFLLRSPASTRRELAELIQNLSSAVKQCSECFRFHPDKRKICAICASDARDHALLAVVASDSDLAALEKSGTYRGYYFVLGGTLDLASDRANHLRIKQLLAGLAHCVQKGLKEIILAFPANPEGDATASRVREEIVFVWQGKSLPFRMTTLGRGLSTGSELEYADSETIKSALEGRK